MSEVIHARLTPDAVFGALIFRERRFDVKKIAHSLAVPTRELMGAIARAEEGEYQRVPASEGGSGTAGSPYARNSKVGDGPEDEVFLQRWERSVLRLIARSGGVLAVARACAIRAAYPHRDHFTLEALHRGMKAQGLRWEIEIRDGAAYYVLTDKSVEILTALISNRWIPVVRVK
jgi:hypothetical protein